MSDHSYTFYHMMGYPVPLQESYFSYGEKSSTYILWATDNSFPWYTMPTAQEKLLQWYGLFFKNIPFVEAVYLHNDICFNPFATTHVECCIVSAHARVWTSFVCYQLSKRIPRIWKRWHNTLYTLDASVRLDEHHTNLISHFQWMQDIRTVYRIAHFVELYQAYPQKINIYKQNQWITNYLPWFPAHQAVEFGIKSISWTTPFKRFIEKILSWRIWDGIEWMAKRCTRIIFQLLKKFNHVLWTIKIFPHALRLMQDKRSSLSILWKMFTKD